MPDTDAIATLDPVRPSSFENIDESAATEHLINLPHMSATAGVGTQEYVAINTAAILALLFGMGSILALMSPVLLVIPAIGLLVSLISLRQIKNSNGTQTGRGLALIGMFLAEVIGVGVLGNITITTAQTRSDKAAILSVIDQFGHDLSVHDYQHAYTLFSLRFQSRVSQARFTENFSAIQDSYAAGAKRGRPPGEIVAVTGTNVTQFERNADNGIVLATTDALIHFQAVTGTDEEPVRLRKSGKTWLIDGLIAFFPEKPGAN